MRVEQQNTNIVDQLKQEIGPKEQEKGIFGEGLGAFGARGIFSDKKMEKIGRVRDAKSVNMKDATYLKPQSEEKKTVVEQIEQAGALDAAERKNQMAVLSNTTSPEDYAKMQEEGFSLEDTTSNTIVTETDKIKAQLAKAGVDISCFGDELDVAQLTEILGSAELATQIVKAFDKADVPCTEENIRDSAEAVKLAELLNRPGDGAIKYMLDNGLEPTIENLYLAEYSGSANYQGDAGPLDMSSFMDQVETVIRRAGYPVNDQTKAHCRWMLENNIPLNEENLQRMEILLDIELPVDESVLAENIATAVSEGRRPQNALLAGEYALADQAETAAAVAEGATDEDVAYVVNHDMDMNLRSLSYAMAVRTSGAADVEDGIGDTVSAEAAAEPGAAGAANTSEVSGIEESNQTAGAAQHGNVADRDTYTQKELSILTAKRQLEELRLVMTSQANYALLKRGIAIDIEPLAKLVEDLRAYENHYYEKLLSAQGVEASEGNVRQFRRTTELFEELKRVPAYVLGMQEAKDASVEAVHRAGRALQDTFAQANERYETLMTAPRADLGDSIYKAFRNVDDILGDLELDTSEANRRAVRILGYNGIAITKESVAEMKSADEQVQRAFKNMTPQTVLEMIRRGVNPLDLNFAELNQTAEQIAGESNTQENVRFAEFLWKLEKDNAISKDERASYIGIYRLIHQVEQSDGAVIGALVNQGAEITMRNLMTAVRSGHHSGKMDYTVDESFGEREDSGYLNHSVTEQIEASYQNQCVKDVAESLTPETMRTVMLENPNWEAMTPEQLKEALAQADSNERDSDYAYAKEQLERFAQCAKASEDIYAVLEKYDIPNTMSNIMAMESMLKDRNGMFRRIFGNDAENVKGDVGADELQEAKEALLKAFEDALSAPEELAEAQKRLGETAENVMKTMIESDEVTSLDVREMRLLSAQLSISSMLAKEEQYSVPVQVSDGVVNVSLKVVRDKGKKGVVDVTMESGLHGKIAATFQAKEHGIKGFVAAGDASTKELLEEHRASLAEMMGQSEDVTLNYAHISDLDLNQFSMGAFGVHADALAETAPDEKDYQVQTARLYQIAESFIRQLGEFL